MKQPTKIHDYLAEDIKQWRQSGEYYGYPECCIRELHDYFLNTPKEEIDKQIDKINEMYPPFDSAPYKDNDVYRSIYENAKPHIGTLVLDFFDVVLLVGVEADEEDNYYVYQSPKGGRGEYWSSAVGSYIPLKGTIDDKRYNYLVWVWNNNQNEGVAI